jgi:DNA-binding transcriptional regulator LsrR (DeoR family)
MRFSNDMTQTEIAAQIGVSQMQISRLLVRTLKALRIEMLAQKHPRAEPQPLDQHAARNADLRRRGTAPRFG